MDLIRKADLEQLLEIEHGPCLSLYVPTVQAGAETRQNAPRLKNLLDRAERDLVEWGMRSPQARDLLEPGRRLQRERAYWQRQQRGLALFLAPEFRRDLQLPFEVPELISVADRFHLKPLLPHAGRNGQFYVLALDLEQIRLFEASQFAIQQIPIDDVPTSMEEGLRFDDPESQLQFHTSTDASGARRPARFFGQGVGVNDVKDDLLRYFQKVDRKLQPYLQDRERPMVMVGIGYSLPIYREANSYAELVEQGIDRNPERMQPGELREAAWELIAERLRAGRQPALEAFGHLLPKQRAARDVGRVVAAAHDGAVDSLFLAREQQIWGTYDPEARQAQTHAERKPGDVDLLDLAAVQVWKNGGEIYLMDPEQVPGQRPAAATLRYPGEST